MEDKNEFEMKIVVDENLSINCKLQKEMSVNDFEAIIMRAKGLAKASGYKSVIAVKGHRGRYMKANAIWDEKQEKELKLLYAKHVPVLKIAEKLKKTPKQCYDKVKNMKSMGRWL